MLAGSGIEVAQLRVRDAPAFGLQPLDGAPDGAVGRPPAEDQQLARGRTEGLEGRNVAGNAGDLLLAQQLHAVVVVRVVADVAGHVGLLESADAMLEPRRAGYCPRPGKRLRVARIRLERRRIGVPGDGDVGQVGGFRYAPRLGAVGQEGVRQVRSPGSCT